MKISTFLAGVTLTAACCAISHEAHAIPAIPTPVTMSMPDGTSITVRLHGDENFHYYTSSDNHLLVADDNGNLCYAIQSGNKLTSSGITAHEPGLRTPKELSFISNLTAETTAKLKKQLRPKISQPKRLKAAANSLTFLQLTPQLALHAHLCCLWSSLTKNSSPPIHWTSLHGS